jgi:hypothetical protein
MKIRPEGAELFHAGRRTHMKKLIASFRNFANTPKNQLLIFGTQNNLHIYTAKLNYMPLTLVNLKGNLTCTK